MPTIIDAQDALIAHLQAMPDRPAIAYPNGRVVTDLPRVAVEVPSGSERVVTIKGCGEGDAEILARVETQDGTFSGEAGQIANNILAHFAPVQRIDGVTIIERPTVRGSYREDGIYYVPVIIRGRFYTQ